MFETATSNFRRQLRAIIENFDAHYDIHQLYAGVLPDLEREPPPAKPHLEDIDDLERYVGCAWARIVAWDVQYHLVKGQAALQESRPAAAELKKRCDLGKLAGHPLALYVTARWFDGAAKLLYRCGDHTLGRMFFTTANQIAEQHPEALWHCRADLWSDYQRNTFEEQRQAGTIKTPLELFQRFIDRSLAEIAALAKRLAHGFPVEPLAADHLDRAFLEDFAQRASKASGRSREALRGICNLLHNAGSIDPETPDGLARRMRLSEASARIAEIQGDEYRLAQALYQQGQLQGKPNLALPATEGSNRFVNLSRSLKIYADIRDNLAAARHKLMCRQQIAQVEANLFQLAEKIAQVEGNPPATHEILRLFGSADTQLEGSIRQLFRLIDDLQALFQKQGNVQGLDIDLHKFTVDAAANLYRQLQARPNADDDLLRPLRKRLRQEQIQMIRGTKKVVKVGTYKHAHSRNIEPIFKELINADLAAQRYPEALAWIEEATSRELLDLLASQHAPAEASADGRERRDDSATTDDPSDRVPPDERVRAATLVDADTDADDPRASVMTRSLEAARWDQVKEAIEASIGRFDEHCLAQPIDTCEQDPEIWGKLNDYAQDKQHAVVRFFEIDKGKYVAFVFGGGGGAPRFVPDLDATETLAAFETLLETHQSRPKKTGNDAFDLPEEAKWQKQCAARLTDLAALIGAKLVQPVMAFVDGSAAHLCFIPSHELFRLPLHLGLEKPEDPRSCIGLRLPCYYATGGAALVRLDRHRRLNATRGPRDVLGVIGTRNLDENGSEYIAFGAEAMKANWNPAATFVVGPASIASGNHGTRLGPATFDGVRKLLEKKPQVLLFSGHGDFAAFNQETHAYLHLDDGAIITPYDLAGLHLKRNHLVVLSACLSGQGTNKGGGEVSGFLRGVMAAGAGAVAVTTWPIKDRVARGTNRRILEELRPAPGIRVDLPRLFRDLWIANAAARDFLEFGCYNLYV
jgi:hypothetical protein